MYCSLHGFITAGLFLVPFTWPYVPYLGNIYYITGKCCTLLLCYMSEIVKSLRRMFPSDALCQNRFVIERHPYWPNSVCMYVCVSNYFSQISEPICIKIIPANKAFYADCYRLFRFEIFTPPYFKPPKTHFWGLVMLNQWEIEDSSCKAHSKNRKIFAVMAQTTWFSPGIVLLGLGR